ncbi:Retrotransposon protein, partial [Thalictrum thalictroides]
MDESLQLEYMNEKNARNLWVALEERFGNFRDSLLSDLEVRWQNLRFSEFKTVMQYNSEALRIKSLMHLCEKAITKDQIIEKAFSTFPVSTLMVTRNYRLDVNARRIK